MDHIHHVTEAIVGSHDHGGHDHGGHDHGHDGGHAMVFHTDVNQSILFRGWETTNALELFGSAVAIFLAGALLEGFKYYRMALHARATTATGDSQVNITKNECGSKGACGGTAVKYSMLSSAHFIQTLLHIIQTTFSHILMLVFMTYNVWLCMALVLGTALGYFFFGWKKTSVVDSNESCQ